MVVKSVKIPETRFELPSLLPPDVELFGVEVGTDMGTYASQLLAAYPMLHLTTVDPGCRSRMASPTWTGTGVRPSGSSGGTWNLSGTATST